MSKKLPGSVAADLCAAQSGGEPVVDRTDPVAGQVARGSSVQVAAVFSPVADTVIAALAGAADRGHVDVTVRQHSGEHPGISLGAFVRPAQQTGRSRGPSTDRSSTSQLHRRCRCAATVGDALCRSAGELVLVAESGYPVSVKGVLVRNDRVLLVHNERDEWELPGGRIEPGETAGADCGAGDRRGNRAAR